MTYQFLQDKIDFENSQSNIIKWTRFFLFGLNKCKQDLNDIYCILPFKAVLLFKQ